MGHFETAREGAVPPPPMRTIGPYQVLALLGRGSHGTVVLARRAGVERLFAIKLLNAGLDAEALARLRREAEVASRLEHPGIVQVHDVGLHGQQPYLVMDHVPGPTLAAALERDGPMDSRAAATLVAELATAVDVAHRAGVVHRDLKPANVIVDGRDGRPKVTDFGLARDLSRPSELTRPGEVLGTPYYMAPEQVRGEPVDARADVYALGVILYELLAGARPFEAPNVTELAWKIIHEKVAPPSARRPGVDPRVEAVCLAALSRSRDARPASARALALALAEACLARGPGPRRGVAPAAVVAAAGALAALSLATWLLAERRRAAHLAREALAVAAQAEALEPGPARARADGARVAALDEELARLEVAAREAARGVERARDADLPELVERARLDGHLAQVVDAVIARLDGVPGAAALRASLLRSRGRWDEGLAVCARARAEAGRVDDLDLLLLQLRLAIPARDEARLQALFDEVRRVAPPDGPHALLVRAFTAAERGEMATALELTEQALRLAPDAAYLHVFRAGVLRSVGEQTGRREPLLAAIGAASQAIERDPTNPDAYGERYTAAMLLALTWPEEARDRGSQALLDVRMARELRPEPDLWVDAGVLHVLIDEPLAAIAELGVALEQAPRGWGGLDRAHVWRGHAQALLGRDAEAVRAWREGRLGALPASTAPLHARWLGRVSEAARAGALEGAPEPFRRAVEEALRAGS